MKKIIALLGILVLGVVLTGCTETDAEVTAPTLTSFKIDNMAASDGTELVTFYRAKRQTVEVDLVLSNPSNLAITSIVINGYNHRVAYFKETSTTRRVIFDLDVGTVTGPLVFSIDEIKYANGENTERAIVSGNNEFKVYIYKDLPIIERDGFSLGQDYITFAFSKTDIDDVIVDGTLRAELYSGESSEEAIIITDDMDSVTFSNLLSSNTYQLRFVASYDLDNNEGVQEDKVLFTGEFSTQQKSLPNAAINNIVLEGNKVSFDVTHVDDNSVIVENGLVVHIYEGDTSIASEVITSASQALVFDGLDGINNNKTYAIRVMADYDLQDGLGTKTGNVLATENFTTPSKSVPKPQILNLNIEENLVDFDVVVSDPESLLVPDTLFAHIYVDGTLIDSSPVVKNHVEFQLTNLFANELFEISITSSFDLNDGIGVQENVVIYSEEFTTNTNEAPSIDVSTVSLRQGYVTLDLSVSDSYNTLKGGINAVLKEDGVIVKTLTPFNKDVTVIEFEYLVTYTSAYTVELSADYNLRDGNGTKSNQVLYSNVIVTVEKKEPVAELKNEVIENDSITFNVRLMDADDTIQADSTWVYLYKDGVLDSDHVPFAVGFDNPQVTFSNLVSNYDYQIIVKSTYDLLDGTVDFEPQTIFVQTYRTLEKEVPTAVLQDLESDNNSLTVDVVITDEDEVIVPGTMYAYLYKDGLQEGPGVLLSALVSPNVTFTGLLSANSYTVKVKVNYDLNNGEAVVVDQLLTEDTTQTIEKDAPFAIVDIISETNDEIVIDVELFDVDSVIDGVARVELYVGETLHSTVNNLIVGLNSNVTFSNVQANTRFTLRVIASYDLNDGNDPEVDVILGDEAATTIENELPTATYLGTVLGKDTITFDVLVNDIDDVIVLPTLVAELIKDGAPTGTTVPLVVGLNEDIVFSGLLADSQYEIIIKTDFNLKDGTPIVEGLLMDSFTAVTEKLFKPSAVVTVDSELNKALIFDITVHDEDETISGALVNVLYAELFKDGVTTGLTENLVVGLNNDISFSGLDFGAGYEVKIFARYNLNDGGADTLLDTIGTGNAATKDVVYISNFSSKINVDDIDPLIDLSQLYTSFDIEVQDTFGILMNPNLIFNLYDENFAPVGLSQVVYDSFGMELLNLQFDHTYTFEIIATVDVGSGVVTGPVYTQTFTTMESIAPSITIDDVKLTQKDIKFDIGITDSFGTLRGQLTALLYEGPLVVSTVLLDATDTELVFDYVAAFDKEYRIEVSTDYNLGDGEGLKTKQIHESVVLIVGKAEPSAEITNIVSEFNQIGFDLELLDIDATVTTGGTISLYDETGAFVLSFPYVAGVTNYNFGSLLANEAYTVKMVADYDVADGDGLQVGNTIFEQVISTIGATSPQATFENPTLTSNSITLDITVLDPDGIINNAPHSLYAYAYEEGVQVGPAVMVAVGTNTYLFPGLYTTTDIDIVVTATYNLNEGNPDIVDDELQAKMYTTLENEIATGTMTLNAEKHNEIIVDVDITDPDGVIVSNLRAEIYEGDTMIGTSQAVVAGANTITFSNLKYGQLYTVKVLGDIDMFDGEPVEVDTEIVTGEYETLALVSITEFNEEKLNTVSTPAANPPEVYVEFTISVTEFNTILSSQDLIVTLYEATDLVTPVGTTTVTQSTANVNFFNLVFNTEYVYTVQALVDHGLGDVTDVIYTETFTTSTVDIPVTSITDLIATAIAITFDVDDMTDDDATVVSNLRVILVKDGVEVSSQALALTGNTGLSFAENGQDGSEYEVIVLATLNYYDGQGDLDDQVLATHTYIYAN